jgi:Domain of unknown function (DUF4214)
VFGLLKKSPEPSEPEALIRWAYYLLLGREPDRKGKQDWLARLENGLSKEEFISAILGSQEFTSRRGKLGRIDHGTDRWSIVKELNCDVTIPLTIPGISASFLFKVPARDESVTQAILDLVAATSRIFLGFSYPLLSKVIPSST